MDDLLIRLAIGRTALIVLGLLLLLAVGAGLAMAILTRRRMMQMMRGMSCCG